MALSGVRTVPLLRDGKKALGDSTAIALYLDQQYPERALLPAAPEARARALELDRYFNRAFGREVRRLCYGYALRYPGETRQLFFRSYGEPTRKLGPLLMGALFERQMRVMYRITRPASRNRSAASRRAAASWLKSSSRTPPATWRATRSAWQTSPRRRCWPR